MRLYFLLSVLLIVSCSKTKEAKDGESIETNGISKLKGSNATVYVGSFTQPNEDGIEKEDSIYVLKMDKNTGELSKSTAITSVSNPSYFAIHPNKRHLYVAERPNGKTGFGWVSVYDIENEYQRIDSVSTHGYGACYVSIDAKGEHVLVANYFEVITSFSVEENGGLSEAISVKKHKRLLPPVGRQETAHPHMILPIAETNMALVPDLGLDSIFHYLVSQEGELQLKAQTPTAKGSGPRHMAFHPNNNWAYVLNELNRTVEVFHVNSLQESFERVQTVNTLSQFEGLVTSAAIHIHPSGKFLYTSNRGLQGSPTQVLSVFSIDANTGQLTLIQEQDTKGKVPRDFNISPDGRFLLVAHQASDDIFTFKINLETGKLEDTGYSIKVTAPVCLKFL